MSGIDGINSLQNLLGGLQTKESSNVTATATTTTVGGATTAGVATGGSVDSVRFSSASVVATDTSDVRTVKVAELRQAISNGTYNVSAGAVADKIVSALLK